MKFKPKISILLIFACLLLNIQCSKGPAPFAGEWTPVGFKLTEHPETLATEGVKFEDIKKQVTYDKETRTGFAMWTTAELAFDVNVPDGGILKLAYGVGRNYVNKGEVTIRALVEQHGFLSEIGTWTIDTSDKDQLGVWHDVIIPTESGTQLIFATLAIDDNNPPPVFIAHPTIVAVDDGAPRKRVIWIAVDTLRADHMGCYGYERPTTPSIDQFAKGATLFERCISSSPWTFPSFASMFTGRYPSIAGAITSVKLLPDEETTLAEIISSNDYATLSITNNPWASIATNMHQGFDKHVAFFKERAKVSYGLAEEWLDRHKDEDCFVFIQLLDPHTPYEPPPEFLGKFDPEYEGRFKDKLKNYDTVRNNKTKLSAREKTHIEALYDEEILGCDFDTGNFLAMLQQKRMFKDSLIIINSDHGEEFWEHGGIEHGHQLYDEVIHVPMIIHGPGFKKERIGTMCGAIDIFPTILQWLAIDIPDNINAVSLYDVVEGKVKEEDRMLLSEQLYFGIEQKGVSTDEYRYILHTQDLAEELYDVDEDPSMMDDVSGDRRATSRNFRYFTTQYTVSESAGWHVRITRTVRKDRLGAHYQGSIMAPSGFSEVTPSNIGKQDMFMVSGNEIHFNISIGSGGLKAFDFATNDENDMVEFKIYTDGSPDKDQWIFIGPSLERRETSEFNMSILDPAFGLGLPSLGAMGPKFHGFYLWGNSQALREEMAPDIDDRTREELQSLGYLQ